MTAGPGPAPRRPRGRPRFALVSREVHPFGGGGIGFYITSTAHLLAGIGEVKIFTTSSHRERYEEMRDAGDPRVPPDDVEVVFVDEADPDQIGGFFSAMHLYSSNILDALRSTYADRGPDLIEFSDYLAEGAVTVQARRGRDPLLADTKVAIRLHTTAEIATVLDGSLPQDFAGRVTCSLERLALHDADAVIWQGGDVLPAYQRYYGADQIAPDHRFPYPFVRWAEASRPEEPRDQTLPLRLLYLGRLERRKGVSTLLKALAGVGGGDVHLTLLGGDTDTAALGTSMYESLRMLADGDGRVEFRPATSLVEMHAALRDCDIVVLPSLWESWPYVALEALQANRPIIATPVGGFVEIVQPGASGWLTDDTGVESLATLIERLIYNREEVDRLRLEGLPAGVFHDLVDPDRIIAGYRRLLDGPGRWDPPASGVTAPTATSPPARACAPTRASAPAPARPSNRPAGRMSVAPTLDPLVSIVIPYYRLAAHVGETVASAFAQTHARTEVIIVNDGSFTEDDWILAELAAEYPLTVLTQLNSGLGAARNFGITQSRGRYVVPLDADNMLEPTFVERTLAILEADPTVAYATTWSRYVDERGLDFPPPNLGYQPIGNGSPMIERDNIAGDAISLMRRWLFDIGFDYSQDLVSYEDWELYRRLGRAGHFGVVIPERLFRYRVRQDSMIRALGFPHTGRLYGEMAAGIREREVRWESRRG
ncbi:MAG TPA: glycosyltransferase [Solirubrobacteraceae bacterium]|jgi:glycosyltransferase involved in cell wall biosynthesis|nr:glycosyltransferase [Solirubrobacteraceae bacterium]